MRKAFAQVCFLPQRLLKTANGEQRMQWEQDGDVTAAAKHDLVSLARFRNFLMSNLDGSKLRAKKILRSSVKFTFHFAMVQFGQKVIFWPYTILAHK